MDNKTRNIAKIGNLMYDWLTASYNIKDAPVSRFVQNIQVDTDVRNRRTGNIWHNGHLTHSGSGRKMGVNITDGRIKIHMCPNKYIRGNNVESVPIMDFLRVMDDLGNELGLDMGYFRIEKLDVTHTAITDYPPMAYFPYLCNQTSTQRHQWDTSLYYNYNSYPIQKVFYDKAREVHKPKTWGGRQIIPDHLKGENLTRFEVRLQSHKSVRNVMGLKTTACVGQLFQEEHIEKLQGYWFDQFDMIPKTTEVNWQLEKNMGKRQFKKTVYSVALQQLGRQAIEEIIEMGSDNQSLTSSEKTKVKKELLGVFDNGFKHSKIQELEKKYKEAEPVWE